MQKNKDEKYGVGKVFPTNNYGNIEIVDKIDGNKSKIKFIDYDEYDIILTKDIKRGRLRPKSLSRKHNCMKMIGEIFQSKNHGYVKLIEMINYQLVKIYFLDFDEYKIVGVDCLFNGVMIPDSLKDVYGLDKIFTTNNCGDIKIIEKLNHPYRKVLFLDGTNYECIASTTDIRLGHINNPLKNSVFDVGYLGVGTYKSSENRKHFDNYKVWHDMIKRCYDEKNRHKYPTYKNVTVCDEWHNFQNFAKWYEENYPHHIKDVKFQLDKDLKQEGIENKIYSPNTVVFLPARVNSFLASVNGNDYIGVSWKKKNKKWEVGIGSRYIGLFDDKEEARLEYLKARKMESEKQKDYLRSLNYLPEEIIELVR